MRRLSTCYIGEEGGADHKAAIVARERRNRLNSKTDGGGVMVEFGNPKQAEKQKLIDQIVRYCQKRNPEVLDRLLDQGSLGKNP